MMIMTMTTTMMMMKGVARILHWGHRS